MKKNYIIKKLYDKELHNEKAILKKIYIIRKLYYKKIIQ